MPEHDPIDELTRFGADFSRAGGDMPLSAADVRRRGDRIRRRRTALVAGGAALAIAAVLAPILALTGDPRSGDRDDLVTRDPDDALAPHDLLTDDDTVHSDGADWFATGDDDGSDPFHLCARASLTDLGATAVLRREFEMRNTIDPSVEVSGDHLAESIAQFPDVASAAAAYDTIAGWVRDCTDRATAHGTPDYRAFEPRPVNAEIGNSEAQVIGAQYGPAPKDLDPYGDSAYIAETGLVRVGDRLAVLDSAVVAPDYDFVDGTPVERMLPVAADRLRPGPNEPLDPRSAPGSRIADDFPLAAGWPETGTDSRRPLTGPLRGLDPIPLLACGESAAEPRRSDRLSAEWVDVDDVRLRQLTTYPTEDAAAEAVAGVLALYRDCPQGASADGTTVRWDVVEVDTGSEAYAVLGSTQDDAATASGETVLVVRVGSAVLVESRGGRAADPGGREQEAATEIAADAAHVVDAMCVFRAATC